MATYYIDPTWAGTKSGTFAAPYSLYSSLPALSAGDFVLQKTGTTATENVTAGYSGTAGNPITYGVYNSVTGVQIATTVGSATISGTASVAHNFSTGGQSFVEIVGFAFTNIKDNTVYGCRLGSNSTGSTDGNAARYCTVTNQTCAGGFLLFGNLGVVGHTVDHCVSSNNSAYGILQASSGSPQLGKINVTNNTCNYNAEAGLRIALSTAIAVSGTIANNTFNYNGTIQGILAHGFGIDSVSDSGALIISGNTCSNNYIIGIRMGNLTGTAGTNAFVASANTCSNNGEHGIQVVGGGGWIITGNTCNYNGADRGNKYGRGIEIYGGSTKPAGPGIVYGNTTSYNYNYGGTTNNGTEGVGIGLDDYHKDVTVFGNLVIGNEGNGIQWNPVGAAGTSRVYGNVLIDNFAAPTSRAASWAGYLKAQMCTYTTENNVNVWNNCVLLTQANAPACLYGFSENNIAAGTSTAIRNNYFNGHSVAMKVRNAITRTNNGYFGNTKNLESNADTSTWSLGTGSLTTDPQLDANYKPQSAAYKGAGANLGGRDYTGKPFISAPTIGAVEATALALRYVLR